MPKNLLQRTDLKKPWLDHQLTVCIAHLEMPEFLFAACQLWLLQTIQPFILVVDTGSNSKASEEVLEDLESHPSIEVARLGILSAVEHSSDRVAHAMDYAFSRCPTEYLLSTHLDLFVQNRDIAKRMVALCDANTPVVGWEMSPRGLGDTGILNGSLSDGIPGHMLTVFHMPTMDRIGAGWSLRRGHTCFDLPREKNAISGWPDTEVCLGKILAQNSIAPLLIGRETNAPVQSTEDWVHLRSATELRLVHGCVTKHALSTYQAAVARIREWTSDDLKAAPCRSSLNDKASHRNKLCHSLRQGPGEPPRTFCAHPKVYVTGQVVNPEICGICSYRTLPPPDEYRRLPLVDEFEEAVDSPQTISVFLLCSDDGTESDKTIQSLSSQTHQPLEVILVEEGESKAGRDCLRNPAFARLQASIATPSNGLSSLEIAIEMAHGDTVCMLPAGSILSTAFLELGLKSFADPMVGIVTARDFDGDLMRLQQPPRPGTTSHQNVMLCGCLIRRTAIFYSQRNQPLNTSLSCAVHELIQDIADAGWTLMRHSGISIHPSWDVELNSTQSPNINFRPQVHQRSSPKHEKVTLFVPLSGRHRAWIQLSRFLERQTWPHDQIRLKLLDTSHDHSFSADVRKWLALNDYGDFTYQHVQIGLPRLADRDRTSYVDEVARATARIYSAVARESETEFIWTLEDDVIPPDDAYERLIAGFDPNCASVSGVYRARNGRTYSVWSSGNRLISLAGTGLQVVEGNGLGCAVLRRNALQDAAMAVSSDRTYFDASFYKRLKTTGMHAKVDWSVECQHLVNFIPF